jgi:SAM-dependent methyltransferase
MVMSDARSPGRAAPPRSVIWHDLECGAYRADLPLWLALAADAGRAGHPGSVLDVGAGTGRVALALARAGHPVSAVEIDPVLLGALRDRAAGLAVEATTADGRTFELTRHDHDLCLVPMQTIQLLRGSAERRSLFERARDHLRPGARLACAIVTDVETFDSRAGGLGPSPELARIGGDLYVSRPVRLELTDQLILIERERLIDPAPGSELTAQAPEPDLIELERLTAAQLHEEAAAVGLRGEPSVIIDETAEHTGSEVVMLRA